MVVESTASGEFLLIGRILFGATLAFMGLGHFLNAEAMIGYADVKGVPAASIMVPATGAMLVLGGLGIVAGAYPVLAAGALAVFFLVSTPTMHDFWNAPDDQRQNEQINFLKNVALFGTSLVFLALGATAWPYAVDVGLF